VQVDVYGNDMAVANGAILNPRGRDRISFGLFTDLWYNTKGKWQKVAYQSTPVPEEIPEK
jgi:hypothetical protein